MGILKKPAKVKLFFGLISNSLALFLEAERLLSKKFGSIDFSSEILPFERISYYNEELGEALSRKFISCERLINAESLKEIKLFTNKLEKRFAHSGRRRINIDPGYLSGGKIVLASTKDYNHRIYLGKGIFAEGTLFYENKSFHPRPWTYLSSDPGSTAFFRTDPVP